MAAYRVWRLWPGVHQQQHGGPSSGWWVATWQGPAETGGCQIESWRAGPRSAVFSVFLYSSGFHSWSSIPAPDLAPPPPAYGQWGGESTRLEATGGPELWFRAMVAEARSARCWGQGLHIHPAPPYPHSLPGSSLGLCNKD